MEGLAPDLPNEEKNDTPIDDSAEDDDLYSIKNFSV
jgi:hypothetical protein